MTLTLLALAYGQEAAPDGGVAPVARAAGAVRDLSFEEGGGLFAYREDDRIVLRSLGAPYRRLASVELPGVLGYTLFREDDSGVQLLAGAGDGTVAAWSVLTDGAAAITPPPTYLK